MTDDFGGADMTERNLIEQAMLRWHESPRESEDVIDVLKWLARECAEIAHKYDDAGQNSIADEILRRCGLSEEGK